MNSRKNSRPKQSHKLRVVRDHGGTADPISTLSEAEQTRLLGLADVALHNAAADDGPTRAGDRARQEHQRIKQELREAVERFDRKHKLA